MAKGRATKPLGAGQAWLDGHGARRPGALPLDALPPDLCELFAAFQAANFVGDVWSRIEARLAENVAATAAILLADDFLDVGHVPPWDEEACLALPKREQSKLHSAYSKLFLEVQTRTRVIALVAGLASRQPAVRRRMTALLAPPVAAGARQAIASALLIADPHTDELLAIRAWFDEREAPTLAGPSLAAALLVDADDAYTRFADRVRAAFVDGSPPLPGALFDALKTQAHRLTPRWVELLGALRETSPYGPALAALKPGVGHRT